VGTSSSGSLTSGLANNTGVSWLKLTHTDGSTLFNYGGLDSITLSNAQAAPANATPSIAIDATPTYTEGTPLIIDSSVTIADDDGVDSELDNGYLSFAITSGNTANDRLILDTSGDVGLSGTTVSVNGVGNVGTLVDSSGTNDDGTVENGDTLRINFNATVTGAAAETIAEAIQYNNSSDDPGTGNRTVTYTINDGTDTATDTATVSITALNDEPTLTATGASPTFTEGGSGSTLFTGATLSTVESGQTVESMKLTVTNIDDSGSEYLIIDGSDVLLTNGTSGTSTGGNTFGYSVAVSGTTATVTLTKSAATSVYDTMVEALQYKNTAQDPSTGNSRVVTLTEMVDSGSNSGSNDNIAALSVASTVTVAALNDEPTLTATGDSPTFIEGGGSQGLFSSSAIDTVESGQNIASMKFTVTNISGSGSSDLITLDGEEIDLSSGNSGTTAANSFGYSVALSAGTATVTLTKADTTGNYQTLVDGLSYRNSAADIDTNSRVVTLTELVDSGSNAGSNDNIKTLSVASTVTMTNVNDQPTLSATGDSPTFTEDGAVAGIFSSTSISTVESGQNITELKFTVTNINDGTDEKLGIDGETITLTDANSGTTTATSFNYSVSLSGTTATVTLTKTDSSANYQTLVDGLTYSNSNDTPNTSDRVFTLTSIKDSGGVANSGDDTNVATLATSTVTVVAANDAPTIAVDGTPSFTENGGAVTVDSTITIADVDGVDADLDDGYLSFQITSGNSANDRLQLDTSGDVGLSGTTVSVNGVGNVGTLVDSSGTNDDGIVENGDTLRITFGAGITGAAAETIAEAIQYNNSSENPNTGNRTITYSLNDGTATATDTATVSVATQNDAPTASGTYSFSSINEDTSATGVQVSTVVAGITSSDAESDTLGIAVTAIAGNGSWQFSHDSSNGTDGSWTAFDGTTPADATALLLDENAWVRYTPDGENSETATFTFRSWDQTTGTASSGTTARYADTTTNGTTTAYSTTTASGSQAVTAVNDAPVVDLDGSAGGITYSSSFSAGGSAVTIADSDGTVSDVDSGDQIESLSATLTSRPDGDGAESLSLDATATTAAAALTVTYTEATGVLSITGAASASTYQTILRGIQYDNSDAAANITTGNRTVNVVVNDGDSNATTAAATVSVVTAPVVDLGGDGGSADLAASYTEGDGSASLASAATISEPDGDNLNQLLITLTNAQDGGSESITLNGRTSTDVVNGITITYTSATLITLSGSATAANYQTLLRELQYANSAVDIDTTARTITVAGRDVSGNSGATATLTLSITAVNDEPTLTATGSTPTFTEGGAVVSLFSSAAIGTVESGQNIESIIFTVTNISDGSDEKLGIDGETISLTDSNSGTTTTNSFGYSVSLSGTTATVTVSKTDTTGNYQSLVDGFSYSNSSDDPNTSNRVFTLTSVKDSGGVSNSGDDTNAGTLATATVSLAVLNDEPTLTATGASPTFTEGDSGATLFTGATLSTVEAGQSVESMKLTVTNIDDSGSEYLTIDGSDVLLTNGTTGTTAGGNTFGYSVAVSGTTATVTLTKSAATSVYDTMVEALQYKNTHQDPSTGNSRVVTLTEIVDSGSNAGSNDNINALSVASTVTVAALNDEPTLTATGASPTFTEGDSGATLFTGATLSTVEAGQSVESMKLTVTNIDDSGSEYLTIDGSDVLLTNGTTGTTAGGNTFGYSVAVSGTTATVTLTKSAATSVYDTMVEALQYKNTHQDPSTGNSRVVTLTEIVDSGSNAGSNDNINALSVASTVTVAALNDEPTLTATGASPTFTEGDSGATLFTGATLSTVEAGQSVESMKLTVTNIDDSGSEYLTIDGSDVLLTNGTTGTTAGGNTFGYSVAVSGTTATVTLTKSAATSVYDTMVEALQYKNTHQDPSTGNSRVVTLTEIVDSGSNAGSNDNVSALSIASTVTLAATNDAPTATAGTTLAYSENGTAAVVDNTIALSDADDSQMAGASVTISSGFTSGDILTFTDTANITGSYNSGSGVLTLSGSDTTANYQAALRSITYASSSEDPTTTATSRTISWTVTDGNSDGAGAETSTAVTSTINLTAVNDAPVTTAGATLAYSENGTAAVIDNTIALSDIDDSQMAGASVTISSGFTSGDTLGFTTIGAISGSYNSSTGVLTLSGTDTIANYQAALRSITYASSSEDPTATAASRTISWSVTDANSDGAGAQSSSAVTSTINLTATNDTPTATAGATLAYSENGTAAVVDNTIALSDADDSNIAAAAVSISSGFTSGDILTFTDTANITGSYNSSTGVLTLSGTDTVANYQTALRTVTYLSSSEDPTTTATSRTISWTVTDGNSDGAGAETSTAVTSTINLTAVNDAPVLTTTAPTLNSTDEDSIQTVTVADFLALNDVDGGSVSGIALTGVSGNGRWEYSLGGSVWNAVGSLSESSALLLESDDQIRYLPDGENGESASIDYRAWDRSSGSAGGMTDATSNGTTTSISANSGTASLTVTDVNDAPTVATTPTDERTDQNQVYSREMATYFSDVDQGQNLSYSAVGLPDGLTIDASSGVVTGTITGAGDFSVVVTADDSNGGTVTTRFVMNVTPAPIIAPEVTQPVAKPQTPVGTDGGDTPNQVQLFQEPIDVGVYKAETAVTTQEPTTTTTQVSVEPLAVEVMPIEVTPVEVAPIEVAPVETAPVEVAPVEAAPVETAPVEVAPVETAPVEAAPVEAAPVEAAPVEAAPVEAAPVETAPVEEVPTEVTPAEEAATEEAATEEAPLETAPAETTPTENQDDNREQAPAVSALKVEPIGPTSSVEVNVGADGQVQFSNSEQSDLSGLTVADVQSGINGSVTVKINDTEASGDALYNASLADGTPLPKWMSIDPTTGTITGQPPEGVKKVEVRILAQDASGKMRALDVTLDFEEKEGVGEDEAATDEETQSHGGMFIPLSEQIAFETNHYDHYGSQLLDTLESMSG